MKRRSLQNATVVLTGASSGIGRAAAYEFARRGANLVLGARRMEVLRQVADECAELGAQAIAVRTDVTNSEEVDRLADKAAEHFGERIDVWVNNAGVGVVGNFAEVPAELHDQVVRTNLLGTMHGAHAALPYFQRQKLGVLINVNSLGGFVPAPYAAAYSASKFGLRGFSAALRAELHRWPRIHVCDVFPAFIDTPGLRHAGNYTGHKIRPLPPVYQPEKVAAAIVSLAQRPRSSVTVGASATIARLLYFLLPGLTTWGLAHLTESYLPQAPPQPITDGNVLHEPNFGETVHGGFTSKSRSASGASAG